MRGPADLLAYRDLFPAVGRTTFLGAHTLAPLARPVRAAVDRFLDIWEEKASAERAVELARTAGFDDDARVEPDLTGRPRILLAPLTRENRE